MRRISLILAIALSSLLLISICLAQQPTQIKPPNAVQSPSPDGPVIGGDGVANYIPLWISRGYLLSSVLYQTGGNVGVGTTAPVTKFDVNGGINTAKTYQIGGSNVVSIGSPTDENLFLGVGAGFSTTPGQGKFNTFSGYQAGFSNLTGLYNTFSGHQVGYANTTGNGNTFSGYSAGSNNTTGSGNSFFGFEAGNYNGSGTGNVFVGAFAGFLNGANENVIVGSNAGLNNTAGTNNVILGYKADYNDPSGSNNVIIGNCAFWGNTGSNNIVLYSDRTPDCQGDQPSSIENTIFIGAGQTAAYMDGIYGYTAPSGVPVYISSGGKLGTVASSLRFKEQVRDMGDSTNGLMKLRPVTFFYKPAYDGGERTLQYGLIAEEVAKLYPELVAYDKEGQPYSVRYQYLTTMLLNELQKERRQVEELKADLQLQKTELRKQNEDLQQRLMRVETLLQSQVNSAVAYTASTVSLQQEGTQK